MKRLIFFFSIIGFSFLAGAQDVTGIWKGYFVSDGGDYYKLEFQVAQNPGTAVKGVSYSYLDIRFYGKATMTGTFTKTNNSFNIREIKTVEVKSSLGGATCIMNYNFTYSRSGKEEYLEGTYLGKYESKYKDAPGGTWGDCGGGKVFLRKVATSDFYVEPFLRNRDANTPVIINKPPVKKDSLKTPVNKPVVVNKPPVKKDSIVRKPPVVVTKPPVKKPDTKPVVVTKPPVKKPVTPVNPPVVIKKPVTDSATVIKKPTIDNNTTKPVVNVPVPSVLKSRSNELVKTLIVTDPDVKVSLYDNGEIDDDTISVYLDKKLVLSSKRLTTAPLRVNLKMDEDNTEHELVMVAENLGRIPPNTSLMIVESGEQRFEVRITSTEQKNAVVRFKYQKPVQ